MNNQQHNLLEHKLFETFVNQAKQIFIGLDKELKITIFNSAASNLYKCAYAVVIAKNYFECFSELNMEPPIPINLLMNSELYHEYESTILMKDGVQRTYCWKIIKIVNCASIIDGIAIIGQDVSDLRLYFSSVQVKERIQKEENERETYLESIIENMPGNIYWKNREGVYIGCNTNTVKTMRVASKADFLGKTLDQVLPKDIAAKILATDNEIIETGVSKIVEEKGPRLDGEQGTYLTQKVPLRDKKGNIIGLLGISFDITERKHSEEALEEAKQKAELQSKSANIYLEHIVNNLPANIYWMDKNCVYLGCNSNVLRLLGLKSRNEFIGKTYDDFAKIGNWEEGQGDSFKKDDLEVITTGMAKLNVEEPPLPDSTGKQVYYLTSRVPLKDDEGNIMGVAGISIDITERKVMEVALLEAKDRAETANKSKSEFLAAVSHELRIPLTGILGMARILADEKMPDNQAKQVHDIIMSGEHLLALVNDLLDLAKLEAGKLELHPSPLDLRKLIEEIATMLSFQAKGKNLELIVDYAIDSPRMIIGDARAIRQILLNLMGNAVKFTERGFVKVKVECLEQEQLKARLAISVEDTGIGIPKEKLNSVFERFNQVDSSRTRRYGGAGLGLTITKAYVELMSGRIWVESEVGKGSRFISQIPFPIQDMVHRPSVWDPYRSQLRVLIVDDTLRGDVIAKQLACAHCQVISNGSQAFNTILTAQQKNEPYHIVIIDQQLQSCDAMQLGRQIHQQRNLQKPMMVLLMPPSTVEARNSAGESGFFETMIKPVHPSELLVGLTAAWERWEDNNRVKNKSLAIFSNKTPVVLLVEDDPIIQKVHTMMLEKVGCKVGVAQNSQEALAMYNQGYDAIFMDVGLPGMSGIEIAAEIRRREAGRGRIPIIGVTGYGYEEDKLNCLNAGMDDVAIKPLKPEELTQLLVKWVAKEHMTA